ncbi:B-cell receptor CD22-like isoform X2 [Salminus brasiliensis]|uniref:B-cell receptor CD22-like isoform X2 n=1 Tax=Salminus brasiliensis TaxID=930266 RepID=UPI003B831823
MSPQRLANITAAVILISLAGLQIPASSGLTVLQGKVVCSAVGETGVKLTCSPICWPSGNCFYSWYRGYWSGAHWYTAADWGCSFGASVWFDSTSSANQCSYSCRVNNNADSRPDCKLDQQWGVTYTPEQVCVLEGSSVDFSCSYKHPGGLRVTKSVWFINSRPGFEPIDLRVYYQYKGRVQSTQTDCRMRITGLRESDTQTYRFRFYTDDPDGKYTGRPGVRVSVSGLKIKVSDTQRGGKKLTCSSTCTLPNSTYIWYRNGQPVSEQTRAELGLNKGALDAGRYSCSVKGHEELRSAAVCVSDGLQVKVEGAAATPSEGQTVTLTCSSMCSLSYSTYIWSREGQPLSECRSASCSVAVVSGEVSYSCAVEGRGLRSPPVYPPKDTRAVVLPSAERVEGDSVTLTCSSDADPPVLTFYWFKQRAAADKALGTGQNYSITNISSQHSGLYYCTALNQLGQHSSTPTRLDVFYPPRPPSLSEFVFNGSVTLVCVSDSNPASSYTWFRKTGNSSDPFRTGSNLTVAAGTGGVFGCVAENPYGSSTSSEWSFTSDNTATKYAASGVLVVLLLIFIAVVLWMRRRATLSYSRSEENSGEQASAPVYDNISTLAVTSGPAGAASSDDQVEVQYTTIQFKRFHTQEVPLCSTVQLINALNEEEEVQYATVIKARPAVWNDDLPIYSTVQKTT